MLPIQRRATKRSTAYPLNSYSSHILCSREKSAPTKTSTRVSHSMASLVYARVRPKSKRKSDGVVGWHWPATCLCLSLNLSHIIPWISRPFYRKHPQDYIIYTLARWCGAHTLSSPLLFPSLKQPHINIFSASQSSLSLSTVSIYYFSPHHLFL